jgi:hypothetical protein
MSEIDRADLLATLMPSAEAEAAMTDLGIATATFSRVRLEIAESRLESAYVAWSAVSRRLRVLEETCRVYDARLADMQATIDRLRMQRPCAICGECYVPSAVPTADGTSTHGCGASAESTGSAVSPAASSPGA